MILCSCFKCCLGADQPILLSLIFKPVTRTFSRCGWEPLFIRAIVVHDVVVSDRFQLADLVGRKTLEFRAIPPFTLCVFACIHIVAGDLARVHAKTLERRNKGWCTPVKSNLAPLRCPLAAVPQACVDAHSLAVGEGHTKVLTVFEHANRGGVHIESAKWGGNHSCIWVPLDIAMLQDTLTILKRSTIVLSLRRNPKLLHLVWYSYVICRSWTVSLFCILSLEVAGSHAVSCKNASSWMFCILWSPSCRSWLFSQRMQSKSVKKMCKWQFGVGISLSISRAMT